ncbi:hypothetical protein [Pontibacter ummariensis]|nr:hypothetical protein [Pontibacter ummariensis]
MASARKGVILYRRVKEGVERIKSYHPSDTTKTEAWFQQMN